MLLHVDSEDSDQTWQMPRLIGVFAGRTGHFVGFVMLCSVFNGTFSSSFFFSASASSLRDLLLLVLL